MENTIYFLSSMSCTKCPIVQANLEEKNIEFTKQIIDSEPELAIEKGIMSVPTIIDNREGHETVYTGQEKCLAFVNTLG